MRLALLTMSVAVLAFAIAACGGGGASPSSNVTPSSLTVEVCTEGEARDSVVYFKNLNDFEWLDVKFSVTKGGEEYILGDEAQSMQGSREKPVNWPSETLKPAAPFADPGDFTYRPSGKDRGTSHKAPLNRLTHFGFLDSAAVNVGQPFELEWSGEVQACS
jgi:hypothetical protein